MTNTNTEVFRGTITLPGNIPGLLRRGSPVFVREDHGFYRDGFYVGPVPNTRQDSPHHLVVVMFSDGGVPGLESYHINNILLDLTDATGRAHAAWWLESRHVLRRHWPYRAGAYVSVGAMHERDKAGRCVYVNIGDVLYYVSRPVRRPGYLVSATTVPTLADLDPNDKTTLPDGSRRVDAEALRRVCLHVAGRGE